MVTTNPRAMTSRPLGHSTGWQIRTRRGDRRATLMPQDDSDREDCDPDEAKQQPPVMS